MIDLFIRIDHIRVNDLGLDWIVVLYLYDCFSLEFITLICLQII